MGGKFASVILFVFLSTAFCADSQISDTRQSQLHKLREEKAKALQAPKVSGVEKGLYSLETRLQAGLRFNFRDFYPRFSSLSSGSGFAPGVRYWRPNIRGSARDLQLSGAYSVKAYQLYELEFGKVERKSSEFFLTANNWGGYIQAPRIPPPHRAYYLYADLRYRHFPQEDFYGIGPDSSESNRTDYLLQDSAYDLVAGYQFNRWLGAGGRFGLVRPSISAGTDSRFPDVDKVFSDITAPGLNNQPDFIRFNSSIFLDYRDNPGNPHAGGLLGFSFSRFNGRSGDNFSFNRYAIDAREYIPLHSEQRVVALRFFASSDDPDENSRVPFYSMETLGGRETLRGFHEFRFRDTNVFYLSGEYRWEGAPGVEFALFYDTGKVFPDTANFNLAHLEESYGFGLRFKSSNSVFLRLDFANSDEGKRFSFNFGPSF